MKKFFLMIMALAIVSIARSQNTTASTYYGGFDFSGMAAGGTSDFTGDIVNFSDQTNQYFASGIQVGDVLWDNLGGRWEVMVVNSSTLTTADVDIRDINSTALAPFGRGAIVRETGNAELSTPPTANTLGISDQLFSRILAHNAITLDTYLGTLGTGGGGPGNAEHLDTLTQATASFNELEPGYKDASGAFTTIKGTDNAVSATWVIHDIIDANTMVIANGGSFTNASALTTTGNYFQDAEAGTGYNTTPDTARLLVFIITGASGVDIQYFPDEAIIAGLSSVAVQNSITGDGTTGNELQLDGDAATPGNSFFYGTNGAGTKGWYAQNGLEDVLLFDQALTQGHSIETGGFNLEFHNFPSTPPNQGGQFIFGFDYGGSANTFGAFGGAGLSVANYESATGGPEIKFSKSRGVIGSLSEVLEGDALGNLAAEYKIADAQNPSGFAPGWGYNLFLQFRLGGDEQANGLHSSFVDFKNRKKNGTTNAFEGDTYLTIDTINQAYWPEYGTGNFTGTATHLLGVTSGNAMIDVPIGEVASPFEDDGTLIHDTDSLLIFHTTADSMIITPTGTATNFRSGFASFNSGRYSFIGRAGRPFLLQHGDEDEPFRMQSTRQGSPNQFFDAFYMDRSTISIGASNSEPLGTTFRASLSLFPNSNNQGGGGRLFQVFTGSSTSDRVVEANSTDWTFNVGQNGYDVAFDGDGEVDILRFDASADAVLFDGAIVKGGDLTVANTTGASMAATTRFATLNGTLSAATLTLDDASTQPGRIITVTALDITNTATLATTASDSIVGNGTSVSSIVFSAIGESYTLRSDGTDTWLVIYKN